MIVYGIERDHRYTIVPFLQGAGAELEPIIRVVPYDILLPRTNLPQAVYVFTDLDRLGAADLAAARGLAAAVERHLGAAAIVNDPRTMLTRFPLIEALRARGNAFAAYRADQIDDTTPIRFPVFLRRDDGHTGAATDLLPDREALRAAIAAQPEHQGLYVVEFADTKDPETGVYTKYSAHRVGDRIVAEHVIFSRQWMLRRSDLVGPEYLDLEQAYVDTNPHEAEIRAVFDLARIGYGRIDYSICPDTGAMRVWEINTNPDLTTPPQAERMERYFQISAMMVEALRALDASLSPA